MIIYAYIKETNVQLCLYSMVTFSKGKLCNARIITLPGLDIDHWQLLLSSRFTFEFKVWIYAQLSRNESLRLHYSVQ